MTLEQFRAVFPIFLWYCMFELLFLIFTSYICFSLFFLRLIFGSRNAVIGTGFHRLNSLFLITAVIMMLWWAAWGRRWWFLALRLGLFLLLFLIAVSRVILFFLWWLRRLFVGGYLLNLIAIFLRFKILFLYLWWWFFWFFFILFSKLGKLFRVVKLGVLVWNYDGFVAWHSNVWVRWRWWRRKKMNNRDWKKE